jgi:hypothetical protein
MALRLCAVYYVICTRDHSTIHLFLISVHCRVQGEERVITQVITTRTNLRDTLRATRQNLVTGLIRHTECWRRQFYDQVESTQDSIVSATAPAIFYVGYVLPFKVFYYGFQPLCSLLSSSS